MTLVLGLKRIASGIARRSLLNLLSAGLRLKRFLRKTHLTLTSGAGGAGELLYDLVNCGPRHRFCTPFAVAHNCLGAGYGVGGLKFKSLAAIYGVELTGEEAYRAISEYRMSNPRVVSLWNTLERNFRWAYQASEPFEMELPSGRALVYEDITPLGNGLRARTTRHGNLTHFYGGKLTENLVQATARDVFVDRYLALAREGAVPLFHIHDEYVFEVPEQFAEEIMPAIVKKASENISWLDGCPIEVEAEIVYQYKK